MINIDANIEDVRAFGEAAAKLGASCEEAAAELNEFEFAIWMAAKQDYIARFGALPVGTDEEVKQKVFAWWERASRTRSLIG